MPVCLSTCLSGTEMASRQLFRDIEHPVAKATQTEGKETKLSNTNKDLMEQRTQIFIWNNNYNYNGNNLWLVGHDYTVML